VAHSYNPSYSGGKDQEDHGSKPARANSSTRPYLKKKPLQKRSGGVAQGSGPDFKPQYHKKNLNACLKSDQGIYTFAK
jgi:hypothetical protein